MLSFTFSPINHELLINQWISMQIVKFIEADVREPALHTHQKAKYSQRKGEAFPQVLLSPCRQFSQSLSRVNQKSSMHNLAGSVLPHSFRSIPRRTI